MGASSSVHFRGLENVLQAYRDRAVEVWSIWQGKQFLTKGNDEESLNGFLGILMSSQSVAIYTIRVYEDITDLKKLKSGTQDDGSFNFRLRDPESYQGGAPGGFSTNQGWQEMKQRLDDQDLRINRLLDLIEDDGEGDGDEGGEPAGVLGAITGLLSDPDKLEKLIRVGKSLLGAPDLQPAYMGNVNRLDGPQGPQPGQVEPMTPEIKLQRLGAAIDVLEQCDPNLVEHLEKLSKMAASKPQQFQTLIGMLDVL